MAAAAHNPAFAKKVGISMDVAKEFNQADKGKKFGKGGEMKASKSFKDMEKKEVEFMKKKGAPKSMIRHERAEMQEEKAEGYCGGGKMKMKKMASGGMTSCRTVAKEEVKKHEAKMHKMAKGGSASARADGIATKGKTKGAMIAMRKGGKC